MSKQMNRENVVVNMNRRDFLKLAGIMGATIAAGGALGGCSSSSSSSSSSESASKAAEATTQTITDMGGTQVEVPLNPTKYADGWYAHNEITIMLTGAEGLVATHCAEKDYKWMYKVCSNMKGATATFGKDFNFEDLAALEPQVIFDSTDDLRDKAAEVGIPLVNCTFKTFDEMKQSIELTAQVFGGNAPEIAKKYNAELDQVLKDTKAKTDGLADSERVSVMHGNSVYTLTIDGTDTIIDDWTGGRRRQERRHRVHEGKRPGEVHHGAGGGLEPRCHHHRQGRRSRPDLKRPQLGFHRRRAEQAGLREPEGRVRLGSLRR